MKEPTKNQLKKIFYYYDGNLYKKKNKKTIGNRKEKYIRIMVNKKRYFYHRLIWIYHNGIIPNNFDIDHINHDTHNNKIENLRIVKHAENLLNKSKQKNNKSGITGVRWNKERNKWRVQICINKKKIHCGYFNDFNIAIKIRKEKQMELGFHVNHGI